jgi:hypothetical protein
MKIYLHSEPVFTARGCVFVLCPFHFLLISLTEISFLFCPYCAIHSHMFPPFVCSVSFVIVLSPFQDFSKIFYLYWSSPSPSSCLVVTLRLQSTRDECCAKLALGLVVLIYFPCVSPLQWSALRTPLDTSLRGSTRPWRWDSLLSPPPHCVCVCVCECVRLRVWVY